MLLDAVFRYRTLLGNCDLGIGLSWDEIVELGAIERAFAPSAGDQSDPLGRRFRREPAKLVAIVRGGRAVHDRVDVVEIGPGGFVCRRAPYIGRGEVVEIAIEIGDTRLKFAARGAWIQDDGEDYRVGLELFGMPVALRTGEGIATATTLDQIAA